VFRQFYTNLYFGAYYSPYVTFNVNVKAYYCLSHRKYYDKFLSKNVPYIMYKYKNLYNNVFMRLLLT